MSPTAIRPNLILLMPDQLRADFLGCYGNHLVQTPHIDKLAQRGLRFERALSPSPICIPARASLLTGRSALTTGVLTNNFWLRPDHEACGQRGLASLLQQQGYHTEAIGKMHFIPWDHPAGFTHRWIAEDKRHIHIQDDYAAYLQQHGLRKLSGVEEAGYREGRMASISPIPLQHQVDVWVGNRSVEFLEQHPEDQPYFLWVAFPGPHDPYNPPQEILNQLPPQQEFSEGIPPTPESERFRPGFVKSHQEGSAQADFSEFPVPAKQRIRRHYAGLVQMIDHQVGRILQALEQRQDTRQTLIFLASDHGDFLGDFDLVGKALFYDSSVRIPLIAAGPSYTSGTSNALVSLTDLYATLLQHAGIGCETTDSTPLPQNAAVSPHRIGLLGSTGAGLMWTNGRWKLSRYKNGLGTLFDLQKDPQEQRNLLREPACAEIREEMESHLHTAVLQGLVAGHLEKSYPYMTLTPDHPGHQRGWSRPYPAALEQAANVLANGWGKAGMPI